MDHDRLDLADADAGRAPRRHADPDVVVNAAAWTDVDGCARDPERAMDSPNGRAPGTPRGSAYRCALRAGQHERGLLWRRRDPYTEVDAPNPLNPYGVSKLPVGEQGRGAAAATAPHRPHGVAVRARRSNFVTKILAAATAAARRAASREGRRRRMGQPDLDTGIGRAIVAVVGRRTATPGVLHLAGEPATSRILGPAGLAFGGPGLTLPTPVPGSTFVVALTGSPTRRPCSPRGRPASGCPDRLAGRAPSLRRLAGATAG